MWITQGLQGQSFHSITTVHYGRRDSRQEGWTAKTWGWRSKVVEEDLSQYFNQDRFMQRQVQRKGLNVEKQLEGGPFMCNSGLRPYALTLGWTRISESTKPSELLNFPAPCWFEMPVNVHSFPFFSVVETSLLQVEGGIQSDLFKRSNKKKRNNVSESLSKFSNGLLSQRVKITGHLEWICLQGSDKRQLALLRLSLSILGRRCLKDTLLE